MVTFIMAHNFYWTYTITMGWVALLPVSFALYPLFNVKTDVQWMGQQVKLVYFNRVDRVEIVHLHDYHELRRGDKSRAS